MGNLTLSVPPKVYYVHDEDTENGNNAILIQLMERNEVKIKRFLTSKLKSQFEADDIFQEALMFLSNREIDNCSDPIKYIWGCVQIMLKRHFSKMHKEKDIITFNSPETYINHYDVEDTVERAYQIDYMYSNEEIRDKLNSIEYLRYEYDYDVFSLLYVRLRIADNEKFEKTLQYLFGDISQMRGYNSHNIKKLICMLIQSEDGLSVLREFVYCAENLDSIIDNI